MCPAASATKGLHFLGFAAGQRAEPTPQAHSTIPAGRARGEHSQGWRAALCGEQTASCGEVTAASRVPRVLQPLHRCDTTGKQKPGLFETKKGCSSASTQHRVLVGVEGSGLLIFHSKQATSIMMRELPPGCVLPCQFTFCQPCEPG